ncbi:protein arginine methyltransferase NDUFAF7, mitochondrial [Pelodytes ibericus]
MMQKYFISLHSLGRSFIVKRAAVPAYHFVRYHCTKNGTEQDGNPHTTSLLKHFILKIKATGPITVAEYMREVLTNPVKGYYMNHDMLGEHGDFITSPEISQIFGELLGIWCISEWMSAGRPKAIQLVELGPGRGTLTSDILRVFSQLQHILKHCDVSVHLVELSPHLSNIQALTLTGKNNVSRDATLPVYMKGETKCGRPVCWYQNVEDVPPGYTFYIAHEFFDALPIHKIQRTKDGWREILIDIDPEVPEKLRFVLSPSSTMVARTFIQDDEEREHVEVCPIAAAIIQKIAHQINTCGGAALIADYGHFGDRMDTFRGFRAHQLHDVLISPGIADLTADVDFKFLKRMVGNIVASLGPITQQEFLKNMGIDIRLKVLLENTKDEATQNQLKRSYDFLMNPEKMGARFKFFSLFPHHRLKDSGDPNSKTHLVAGFSDLTVQ